MRARFSCFNDDGTCSPASPDILTYYDLDLPVGAIEGARPAGNRAKDVKTVQDLLNRVGPADGGPSPKLAVDGLCGPLTRAAIRQFQKAQFTDKLPDGIVDPKYRTIARLNDLAYPDIDPALLAITALSLGALAAQLRNTLAAIQAVQMYLMLPNPIAGTNSQYDLVNYHFKLDKSPDPLADIARIRRVYQDMQLVCAHVPRGPNQKPAFGILDRAPTAQQTKLPRAFARLGGWQYHRGETEYDKDHASTHRIDMIFVSRRLMSESQRTICYVLLHEIAHFVGGDAEMSDAIWDRAYYRYNRTAYERLTTEEAMTNADCYVLYNGEVNFKDRFTPAA